MMRIKKVRSFIQHRDVKVVLCVIAAVCWGAAVSPRIIVADDDTAGNDAVIERLKRLEERIAELERLLSEPKQPPPHKRVAPRGFEPSPFDEMWDPWGMMERMRKRMQRIWEEAQKDVGDWSVHPFRVKTDIQEKRDRYVITMDLPGMEQDQIDVKVQNGLLIVSGQRRQEETTQDDVNKFYRRERSFGYFHRVLSLPDDADPTGMKTEYKNGVLTVTLPKKGRSII